MGLSPKQKAQRQQKRSLKKRALETANKQKNAQERMQMRDAQKLAQIKKIEEMMNKAVDITETYQKSINLKRGIDNHTINNWVEFNQSHRRKISTSPIFTFEPPWTIYHRWLLSAEVVQWATEFFKPVVEAAQSENQILGILFSLATRINEDTESDWLMQIENDERKTTACIGVPEDISTVAASIPPFDFVECPFTLEKFREKLHHNSQEIDERYYILAEQWGVAIDKQSNFYRAI